jgi:hypothetical protein
VRVLLQSLVPVAGRVLDGELASEPVRCEAEDRGVAEGVQRGALAQQSGISDTERVCYSDEGS